MRGDDDDDDDEEGAPPTGASDEEEEEEEWPIRFVFLVELCSKFNVDIYII